VTHKIATAFQVKDYVDDGGLMSYGPTERVPPRSQSEDCESHR
jgi:hypothetical protein